MLRQWRGGRDRARCGRLLFAVAAMWLTLAAIPAAALAHDAPAPPAMDKAMSSAGWLQRALIRLENEAIGDVAMLPATPGAIEREWRTFARDGSAFGALVNLGWVALAVCLALLGERLAADSLGRRVRRAARNRAAGPGIGHLLLLALCDAVGLAAFAGIFVFSRHWLTGRGVTIALIVLAGNVVIRWRIAVAVVAIVLRPTEPMTRLLDMPDEEARGLARFFSAAILAIVALIGFGRYGLIDEDSGAAHIVALTVAVAVCALYALIVFRARRVAEALIAGCSGGVIGALRAAIARAWLAIGLALVAALFVFFVFGLSLGLLSYYHAGISTLGVVLVLLVLERLADKGWRRGEVREFAGPAGHTERLVAHGARRILRGVALLAAATTLAAVWIDAIGLSETAASAAFYSSLTAFLTLFVAFVAWELSRLAIDGQLQRAGAGPRLPGQDDDSEAAPGSRLQTILPMLRAGFGIIIAVVAALTVLSHLGIDTAPLIAGAGVFGLAISFGAQSLVRDIISGLFYIWDDAFRVGEYIDTGRLKGTVEALGIRSVKLRHHNGPLHTIPYGQLGAVTNQSRDFATIKFNLRLAPGTDLELVRKTAKRIGLDLQDEPEIAAEVILPLKMQGLVEVADSAVVVRFKFTARPVKPSWVQREYLKRIYRVFAEKGIAFATGTLTLQTVAPPDAPALPPPLLALPSASATERAAAIERSAAPQTQPA
ncbi:MAG TPA: mechanosensitive ion channel family protein [Stellaceae bacterium]|nr:mechanosensitive ion channel family protein [Stellaceae bacterium]